MNETPQYLFSHVKHADDYRPDVTAIVLFGMAATDGHVFYLEIRYIDYENDIVEGDHLMWSLEEAYEYAFRDYGIQKNDWRQLSLEEIKAIDSGIG
ncbi:hypothetical protein EA797_03950 [Stutzerimonas zhaodongensis]|uniref:Uncharacterized protein n=1 Tax=Stutzerimonas zhaodongensis TaxID=1176257 RepID=A0A3M2HW70_9GAMM|nr:hypothetical protein [Stutzerimonas zhaodongensis]MCQ4317172.1 hypothetical protein [Stutzerimonas zhaodongensis]RMH91900.1 hypothetical protein EA797_03950 [Stutzerimonas zhaodongensis]